MKNLNTKFKQDVLNLYSMDAEKMPEHVPYDAVFSLRFQNLDGYESLDDSKAIMLKALETIQKLNPTMSSEDFNNFKKSLSVMYDATKEVEANPSQFLENKERGLLVEKITQSIQDEPCIGSVLRLNVHKFSRNENNKEKVDAYSRFLTEQKDVVFSQPYVYSETPEAMDKFQQELSLLSKSMSFSGNVLLERLSPKESVEHLLKYKMLGADKEDLNTFTPESLSSLPNNIELLNKVLDQNSGFDFFKDGLKMSDNELNILDGKNKEVKGNKLKP